MDVDVDVVKLTDPFGAGGAARRGVPTLLVKFVELLLEDGLTRVFEGARGSHVEGHFQLQRRRVI